MGIYDFCAQWAATHASEGVRILDYGCGCGAIVEKIREKGLEAYGCDMFYEGGDYSAHVASKLLDGGIIRRMDGDRIPFEDRSFDLIINNQVLEHVRDLEIVLIEMNRVLKPGGKILSLFPDHGVWHEGHSGIPFLHWFPKSSKSRVFYAFILRCLGFGYHKLDKSNWQWSKDFCEWLDNWTYYRSRSAIGCAFNRYIGNLRNLESDYLAYRLKHRAILLRVVPNFVSELIVRKLGCLVFETKKRT